MKSWLVISGTVLFLLLLLPISNAQIGIKAGLSIVDIAFLKNGQTPYLGYEINSLEHRKPMLSFQVGAFSTFSLGKRFGLQPELLFAQQGLDYSTAYLYDDIRYKINISYLQLPLLLRYKVATPKNWQPVFFVGPYGSVKLKAARITKMEGKRERTKVDNVRGSDVGIVAGFSVDYVLRSGRMVFDLRSSFSLTNMMEPIEGHIPWYYGPEKEYARNVNISLTVGYQFSNLWSKKAERQ